MERREFLRGAAAAAAVAALGGCMTDQGISVATTAVGTEVKVLPILAV